MVSMRASLGTFFFHMTYDLKEEVLKNKCINVSVNSCNVPKCIRAALSLMRVLKKK